MIVLRLTNKFTSELDYISFNNTLLQINLNHYTHDGWSCLGIDINHNSFPSFFEFKTFLMVELCAIKCQIHDSTKIDK